MPLDPQCIFCRIVRGEAEASLVYRDSLVTAFMDVNPIASGHLLIIPNDHVPDLAGLPAEAGSQMMSTAGRLSRALRRAPLRVEGINLHLAEPRAGLPSLPTSSGTVFAFPPRFGQHGRDRAELEEVAAMIRGLADGGEVMTPPAAIPTGGRVCVFCG
jgi:diadenosine tetraphosphate (Ap4A) HIT family hydrolase